MSVSEVTSRGYQRAMQAATTPGRRQRWFVAGVASLLLLLSLVHALTGEVQAADRYAREGIAIGQRSAPPGRARAPAGRRARAPAPGAR